MVVIDSESVIIKPDEAEAHRPAPVESRSRVGTQLAVPHVIAATMQTADMKMSARLS